jgi:hypothetical protein
MWETGVARESLSIMMLKRFLRLCLEWSEIECALVPIFCGTQIYFSKKK